MALPPWAPGLLETRAARERIDGGRASFLGTHPLLVTRPHTLWVPQHAQEEVFNLPPSLQFPELWKWALESAEHRKWTAAMDSEIESLQQMETWGLAQPYPQENMARIHQDVIGRRKTVKDTFERDAAIDSIEVPKLFEAKEPDESCIPCKR
eukprot:gene20023-26737_t